MSHDELVKEMGKALDAARQQNTADDNQLREIYRAARDLLKACEKEAQRRGIVLG